MFIRFRQTATRLQISLVEVRRVDGKVRQEHIASLGSVARPPSVADRVALWAGLFERFDRLSNRVAPEMRTKLLDAINARVPLVTPDEQRALQLENAKAEVEQWSALRDLTAADVEGREKLISHQQAVVAAGKAAISEGDEHLKKAEGRVAAIERGESVAGGLGKPRDVVGFLKSLGWIDADLRHARLLAMVPEEHFEEFLKLAFDLGERGEQQRTARAALAIIRKYGGGAT